MASAFEYGYGIGFGRKSTPFIIHNSSFIIYNIGLHQKRRGGREISGRRLEKSRETSVNRAQTVQNEKPRPGTGCGSTFGPLPYAGVSRIRF
jgi:hypothetical protein